MLRSLHCYLAMEFTLQGSRTISPERGCRFDPGLEGLDFGVCAFGLNVGIWMGSLMEFYSNRSLGALCQASWTEAGRVGFTISETEEQLCQNLSVLKH